MSEKITLTNALLTDPSLNLNEVGSIVVENGLIVDVIKGKNADSGKVIDLKGQHLTPGFIDLRCELGEPGYEQKETVRTGTDAAAAGGFTTLCLLPMTQPVNDSGFVTQFIQEKIKQSALVSVFQWAMKKKPSKSLLRIQKQFKKYYILIMHRQEHVFFRKDWTKEVLRYVIQNTPPHVTCIMFDHPLSNAIVSSIQETLTKKQRDNIKALSMLSYSDFLHLVEKSEFVASDSATNQYETFLLGKPYLSLRERTEQIEGLGENVVLAKGNKIVMKNFLKNYSSFCRKKVNIRKRPSSIIVDYLAQ
jgi:hypothetical protein